MNATLVAAYCYAGPAGIVLVAIAMGWALTLEVRDVIAAGRGLFAEDAGHADEEVLDR